jgi:hypothetical protein
LNYWRRPKRRWKQRARWAFWAWQSPRRGGRGADKIRERSSFSQWHPLEDQTQDNEDNKTKNYHNDVGKDRWHRLTYMIACEITKMIKQRERYE